MTDALRPNRALQTPPATREAKPVTTAPVTPVPAAQPSVSFQRPGAAERSLIPEQTHVSWRNMRTKIVDASIGIPADLASVLDKIAPNTPGRGFPLSHTQTHDVADVTSGRVTLRPENLSIGQVKDNANITSLVASYTDVMTHEVLGYVIRWFDIPGKVCQRKYLMFKVGDPRTKGVGMQVASAWDAFVPLLGIEHTTIEAAYVGRLVWALEGFDFDNEHTRATVKLNFARFLIRHDLHPNDLYLRRDDGTTEPFAFDKLHYPWDFAHVVSKLGTLRLPTRTSNGVDEESTLDAGRAFMLGDFRRPELKECVCPDYFGERPTDPSSPSQRQARAYATRAGKAPKP